MPIEVTITAIGSPVTIDRNSSASSSNPRGSAPSVPVTRIAANTSSHHWAGSGTARCSIVIPAPVASVAATRTRPWDAVARSSAQSASAGRPVTTTNTTAGAVDPASAHIATAKTAADPASTVAPSVTP